MKLAHPDHFRIAGGYQMRQKGLRYSVQDRTGQPTRSIRSLSPAISQLCLAARRGESALSTAVTTLLAAAPGFVQAISPSGSICILLLKPAIFLATTAAVCV